MHDYLCGMFVRKVPNRSGSIGIQVISKSRGVYEVIKTFGSSKYPEKIEELVTKAQHFIHSPKNQMDLFFDLSLEDKM
ncbi:MAG: hypothetical protein HYS98_09005 [Deltaproteobacteria bacterium]|nr:hypothetical protein [Deltaproteobacteria bacterium]